MLHNYVRILKLLIGYNIFYIQQGKIVYKINYPRRLQFRRARDAAVEKRGGLVVGG